MTTVKSNPIGQPVPLLLGVGPEQEPDAMETAANLAPVLCARIASAAPYSSLLRIPRRRILTLGRPGVWATMMLHPAHRNTAGHPWTHGFLTPGC